MRPRWFHVDDIPYGDMWPDDEYWVPLFLAGTYFRGQFHFDEQDAVIEYDISEVEPEVIQ